MTFGRRLSDVTALSPVLPDTSSGDTFGGRVPVMRYLAAIG